MAAFKTKKMIHIVRARKDNKQFMAVNLGNNREPLAPTEIETTKQSIIKNLAAQLKSFTMNRHDVGFYFQDDTLKVPKVYYVYNGKRYDKNLTIKPESPYISKKKRNARISKKDNVPD